MEKIMTYKLMIKTHNETGLKYLCKTEKEGKSYEEYLGSGTRWRNHLKKHGSDISTDLIFQCENFEEFRKYALNKSIELDVVESDEWANLVHENREGGMFGYTQSDETIQKNKKFSDWSKAF